MPISITIKGQNARSDYYRAYREYWSRMPTRNVSKAGSVMVLLTGSFLIYSDRSNWIGYALIAVAPVVWLNLIALSQVYALIVSNPQLVLPFEVVFDDSGVSMTSERGKSQMAWKQMVRFIESREAFLMFISRRSFLVFPKRFFTDDQTELLRKLLGKKVRKSDESGA
jgi:hypothetical protein